MPDLSGEGLALFKSSVTSFWFFADGLLLFFYFSSLLSLLFCSEERITCWFLTSEGRPNMRLNAKIYCFSKWRVLWIFTETPFAASCSACNFSRNSMFTLISMSLSLLRFKLLVRPTISLSLKMPSLGPNLQVPTSPIVPATICIAPQPLASTKPLFESQPPP